MKGHVRTCGPEVTVKLWCEEGSKVPQTVDQGRSDMLLWVSLGILAAAIGRTLFSTFFLRPS